MAVLVSREPSGSVGQLGHFERSRRFTVPLYVPMDASRIGKQSRFLRDSTVQIVKLCFELGK